MSDFKLTDEQQYAKECAANGETFVMDAVAGSGKTSTAREMCKVLEGRGLYLVYNSSAAADAKKSFPRGVKVSTTSALAWNRYPEYQDRMRPGSPRVRAKDTAALVGLTQPIQLGGRIMISPISVATMALETIQKFCYSADTRISEKHTPPAPAGMEMLQEDLLRSEVAAWARKIWIDAIKVDSKHRFTFDYAFKCQPAGTMVKVVERESFQEGGKAGWRPVWREVPIEQVKKGDRVVSATGRGYTKILKNGREVTSIGNRHYEGNMVTAATENGRSSSYTHDHICVASFSEKLRGKHLVYMMRRGGSYRIGKVRWDYGKTQLLVGPSARIRQQKAEAFWILSVHDTDREAATAEALACYEYGIPGWQFIPMRDSTGGADLEVFWSKVGDNFRQAELCLRSHGRDIKYPLWREGDPFINVRSPRHIHACNLISGMKVCDIDNVQQGVNGQLTTRSWRGEAGWSHIEVTVKPYAGMVYSMEVDKDHVYFADGILTHNCLVMSPPDLGYDTVIIDEAQDSNWATLRLLKAQVNSQLIAVGDPAQQLYSWRGASDIMGEFGGKRLPLSKSFRFGERIAEEANKWLEHTQTQIRVTGNEQLDSIVTDRPLQRVDAVLCRSNAAVMERAIKEMEDGKKVAIVGGTQALVTLAKAAGDLMEGKKTSHPELSAFSDWGDLMAFTQEPGGGDLKALVQLINTHKVSGVLKACNRLVAETPQEAKYQHRTFVSPDVVISTAHKSKGREWLNVEVGDDFKEPEDVEDPMGIARPEPGPIGRHDAMLHYVTVTRARSQLNRGSLSWIDRRKPVDKLKKTAV